MAEEKSTKKFLGIAGLFAAATKALTSRPAKIKRLSRKARRNFRGR